MNRKKRIPLTSTVLVTLLAPIVVLAVTLHTAGATPRPQGYTPEIEALLSGMIGTGRETVILRSTVLVGDVVREFLRLAVELDL